uniref:Putative zn2+-binding protein melusin/rar1 n=1 Tax=Tabanus bromius TaxID=304241 RepID=A0A0K8TLR9_TABBR
MLQCYNRGCGQKFDPEKNTDESCRHHPGDPFFHDAYKGWSCCNKKTVDFTEFLNIKGCTLGQHSNIKPPEPEKPVEKVNIDEIIEKARKPPEPLETERPPFDSNLVKITPNVVQSVKDAIDNLAPNIIQVAEDDHKEIKVGTICKNSGCNFAYASPESDEAQCQYHPGVPIFHEGMKFWSCCTKRTTDFNTFMNQPGCTFGKHKWFDDKNKKDVECRYDWHQTGSTVVVAVYAKMYHYEKSYVKVNPIRLQVMLVFPEQGNGTFKLDLELRGVIKPNETKVRMSNTKVEITLQKADPTSWSKLEFPRTKLTENKSQDKNTEKSKSGEFEREGSSDVDLDDIEPIRGLNISNAQ